jgi:3-deoxy-D-manno-octulosonate 8-phosphate phosphatase KdsC-like HAD superfamily phosphatase
MHQKKCAKEPIHMVSAFVARAQKFIDKKADYVLAFKGNQGSLREAIASHLLTLRVTDLMI